MNRLYWSTGSSTASVWVEGKWKVTFDNAKGGGIANLYNSTGTAMDQLSGCANSFFDIMYNGTLYLSSLAGGIAITEGPANLIVLSRPKNIKAEKIVPNELMFVDLWNLKEWYAKDFLKALRQKMGLEQ